MNSRVQAFFTHLALSAVVALCAVGLVFFVWYPSPLHKAAGVTEIFLLLLSIDIVLGPLITAITYKPTPHFLKFDLPIIVLLQVIALSYGVHTMFQGRPAYLVFNRGSFSIVRELDVDAKSLVKARASGNTAAESSWFVPRWVAAIPSTDVNRRNEVFFSALDWNQLPESYAPLDQAKAKIMERARPLSELKKLYSNDSSFHALDEWQETETKWLPLRGTIRDMVVLIKENSGEMVKIVDIDPYPNTTKPAQKSQAE